MLTKHCLSYDIKTPRSYYSLFLEFGKYHALYLETYLGSWLSIGY